MTSRNPAALVITDMLMPESDGIEIITQAKKKQIRPAMYRHLPATLPRISFFEPQNNLRRSNPCKSHLNERI
ncbi:MAG: hypothetical protein M2R45_02823 [Verrucomicrobia subdivision 3 bacterium]|nr:hypothetical protein [Limisphaerales bacterium]MCS1415474.1 hypothetical protein [Limisphaerales bacterium]